MLILSKVLYTLQCCHFNLNTLCHLVIKLLRVGITGDHFLTTNIIYLNLYYIFSLPFKLGTLASLKALVLDGNPLRSIRRDIVNVSLIDRFTNIFKLYACLFNKGCS